MFPVTRQITVIMLMLVTGRGDDTTSQKPAFTESMTAVTAMTSRSTVRYDPSGTYPSLMTYAAPTEIRIGYICPKTGASGLDQTAAAITMAIEDAQRAGYLRNINISVHWRESGCDGKTALGKAVELKYETRVDAYLGLPCADSATNAGKLIAYWNMPHFSYSSPDPLLANKTTYSTLVRMVSPFNKLAEAVVLLFRYFKVYKSKHESQGDQALSQGRRSPWPLLFGLGNCFTPSLDLPLASQWSRAVMLTGEDAEYYCDYASRSLDERFRKNNISLTDWMRIDQTGGNLSNQQINEYLDLIKMRGRIVLICLREPMLVQIMLAARSKGMTEGEYVFIYPSLFPSPNLDKLWARGKEADRQARLAFAPLLQIVSGFVASEEADRFRTTVARRMTEDPWYNNYLVSNNMNASVFSLYTYDAVFHYCLAVDKVLKERGDFRNGRVIFETARHLPFWKGKSGLVMLDDQADRLADYWVYQLERNASAYSYWAAINISASLYSVLLKSTRYWGATTGFLVPRDRPPCGFFDELCPSDNTNRDTAIVVTVVVLILCGLIGGMGYYIYRKKKFEDEVERMLWKASYGDIVFMKVKSRSCSTNTNDEPLSPGKTSKNSSSVMSVLGRPDLQGILDVAYYKGDVVAVRRLRKTSIALTRAEHLELKIMRDMNHENLNAFVGLCVEAPNICILTKYCSKGSLQDVIENDAIKLDTMFKSSLVADIIMGMEYLHKSTLRCHGRLKSTNCIVDSRWVLKITDYGLNYIREDPEEEHEYFKSLLWTSPERLRDPALHESGTQKGDVYSFAIILQEVIYRCGPFETSGELPMIPKDLIGRVRNGESTPYRPVLPQLGNPDNFASDMLKQMQLCWQEDPSSRPDFPAIKAQFLSLNKGKRFNIMDNMIRMMEKYANNLEEVVAERTYQLTEEKKKTDMLLYRMLPEVVANKLKMGKSVAPEEFESASIYFSDIVQFTELASDSSPIEVVDFLNDLWTTFDDVIAKYNVYKVETIGDAYMVCSGLPERIPSHATEISNMALDILSQVTMFTIRHRPSMQLRVRIGLHSGSVASGVIGLTMPRYCLFGDTVNTASRMESTGKPQRIQISCSTQRSLVEAGGYYITARGEIAIKGKGMQTTYWLLGREGMNQPLPDYEE